MRPCTRHHAGACLLVFSLCDEACVFCVLQLEEAAGQGRRCARKGRGGRDRRQRRIQGRLLLARRGVLRGRGWCLRPRPGFGKEHRESWANTHDRPARLHQSARRRARVSEQLNGASASPTAARMRSWAHDALLHRPRRALAQHCLRCPPAGTCTCRTCARRTWSRRRPPLAFSGEDVLKAVRARARAGRDLLPAARQLGRRLRNFHSAIHEAIASAPLEKFVLLDVLQKFFPARRNGGGVKQMCERIIECSRSVRKTWRRCAGASVLRGRTWGGVPTTLCAACSTSVSAHLTHTVDCRFCDPVSSYARQGAGCENNTSSASTGLAHTLRRSCTPRRVFRLCVAPASSTVL